MPETTVREGVLQVRQPGTRWLSSGFDGGIRRADAAYNVTVPEGFDRTDLAAFAAERRAEASFEPAGPTLLTGVAQRHARGARRGSVTVLATAGLSNPATLPMEPERGSELLEGSSPEDGERPPVGTVNLLVTTTHALDDGGLASLMATAVEAKTATLLQTVGFTGTTSDAVVVGADPGGEPAEFAGSATPLGDATRACVRESVRASLEARYADERPPASVDAAAHGAVTDGRADTFEPTHRQ